MTRTPYCDTVSGKKVNLYTPSALDICMVDIAWGLQAQRWGSQIPLGSRTIAEHSIDCVFIYLKLVEMEALTWDRQLPLLLLLHDAHEAYCLDIPGPIKPHLSFRLEDHSHVLYTSIADGIQSCIDTALGIVPISNRQAEIVHDIDILCRILEYAAARGEVEGLVEEFEISWPTPTLEEHVNVEMARLSSYVEPLMRRGDGASSCWNRTVTGIFRGSLNPRNAYKGVRHFLQALELCHNQYRSEERVLSSKSKPIMPEERFN